MRYLALALVYLYKLFSPLFQTAVKFFGVECHCKYPITCSEFAFIELKTEKNFFVAIRKIINRIISCGPWSAFLRN